MIQVPLDTILQAVIGRDRAAELTEPDVLNCHGP